MKTLNELLVERIVGIDLKESDQSDELIKQGLSDFKSLIDIDKKYFPQGSAH